MFIVYLHSFLSFFARLRKQIIVTFLYTVSLAYSTSPLHIRQRILFLHSTILDLDFCVCLYIEVYVNVGYFTILTCFSTKKIFFEIVQTRLITDEILMIFFFFLLLYFSKYLRSSVNKKLGSDRSSGNDDGKRAREERKNEIPY